MIGCGGGRRCCVKNQASVPPARARQAWRKFFVSLSTFISLAQVFFFVVTVVDAGRFMPVSANAMWGPHPYFLDRWGAKNTARMLHLGEWWRLLTPSLLHSGVGHLLANLLAQMRLGMSLEA